jgi:hypothetical protein
VRVVGGIFTCCYAKALALNRALGPLTDIGQGSDRDYVPSMRLQLVDDLFVDSWTVHTMPFGDVNHQQRYAPGSTSEPQHGLFWHTPFNLLVDIHTLRSRTGLYDHMATRQDLVLWYLSRPPMLDVHGSPRLHPSGRLVHMMEGFLGWSEMTWRDFVTRIEWRMADINNGQYPRV